MTGNEKTQGVKLALLAMLRHPWEQGTAAGAFIESGDERIGLMMAHEAVYRQGPDGRLACLERTNNITDPCACGESVIFAYEKTGDPMYLEAAQRMLAFIDSAPGSADGVQYHNFDQPMIAADCMYMVPTFYAAMGRYDEAVRQVDLRFRLLWNEEKRAMNHQWDDAKQCLWRDKRWGAATGWNIAAIAKVADRLPETMAAERARLAGYLDQLVSGILTYQLGNGLFYDVLDEPDTFVETNCAQMTAYGIYRAVAAGLLDKKYLPAADRMRAAANAMVDAYGLVRNVAGAPAFNAPGVSPEGQAFYILMESAARRIDS